MRMPEFWRVAVPVSFVVLFVWIGILAGKVERLEKAQRGEAPGS